MLRDTKTIALRRLSCHYFQDKSIKVKNILFGFLHVGLVGLVIIIPASTQAAPLGSDWVVVDEFMSPGDFFTGSWTVDNDTEVRLEITDLFVISDQFEVYDNGILLLTTPAVSDWVALGCGGPFDSAWLAICFPVDPYGWADLTRPDPYLGGQNVRLWE